MQSFNDILFCHKNIFKVDRLKQVYLTKLTDDARKTSAIRGQNKYQTTPHLGEISLKTPLDFPHPYSFHLAKK